MKANNVLQASITDLLKVNPDIQPWEVAIRFRLSLFTAACHLDHARLALGFPIPTGTKACNLCGRNLDLSKYSRHMKAHEDRFTKTTEAFFSSPSMPGC